MAVTTSNKILIKEEATRLGFDFIGFAKAEFMEPEARRLEAWLNQNHQGKMAYMANHFDKRVNPTLLVPGAKTVISLSYNYFTNQEQQDASAPKISKYAYGHDYHHIVKGNLKSLFNFINEKIGSIKGRAFVDSAPVMERDWGKRSGVGWIGKHSLLINKNQGSFFFLAELIIDLEIEPDLPVKDYCGTCTKCIEACPTDAIKKEGYVVDGSKCISYLTIELKEAIPEQFKGKMKNWMFGCDICQDVCPWNRFSKVHSEDAFLPNENLLNLTKEEWNNLTEDTFKEIFRKSPVKRTKYAGLKRNINFLEEKGHT